MFFLMRDYSQSVSKSKGEKYRNTNITEQTCVLPSVRTEEKQVFLGQIGLEVFFCFNRATYRHVEVSLIQGEH